MVEGKEQFINRISNCLGRDRVPDSSTSLPTLHDAHHEFMNEASIDELKMAFIHNSEFSGTLIYQCGIDDLNQTLIKAITDFESGPVIMADQDFFHKHNTGKVLDNHFDQVKTWDLGLSREENISTAEQATIGLVKAELGLAESGTVVLFSHKGAGRSVSLLPTYTVTVILEQDLRPRLTQAMSFLMEQTTEGLPPSINFISGASSTADIELVRVQGVHGPLATSYVIVS